MGTKSLIAMDKIQSAIDFICKSIGSMTESEQLCVSEFLSGCVKDGRLYIFRSDSDYISSVLNRDMFDVLDDVYGVNEEHERNIEECDDDDSDDMYRWYNRI